MATPPDIPSFGKTLMLAIGFAFVIEGVFYALLAGRVPDLYARLAESSTSSIRKLGIGLALVGLAWMIWIRYSWFQAP